MLINNLREQFYRYRMEYVKDIGQRSTLIAEHERLMNAIFNHDSAAAKKLMNEHLQNQQDGVIHSIQE